MAIERRAALTRSHKWVFATQLINHSQLLLQFTVIISECFPLRQRGRGRGRMNKGYPVSSRQLEMLIRIATEIDRREIRVLRVVNPGQGDRHPDRPNDLMRRT